MNFTKNVTFYLVALFFLAGHSNVVAGITKCVSDDGQVYFSDSGCPDNTAGQTMNIRNQRTSSAPVDHRYSIENQARAMEAERAAASTSERSLSSSVRSEEEKQRKLSDLDEQMLKIDKKISDAREESMSSNSIRSRWAREKIIELKREKDSLQRQRENLLGIIVKPARSEEIERAKRDADFARMEAERARMEADHLKTFGW